jgi:O-methyltransferase domain
MSGPDQDAFAERLRRQIDAYHEAALVYAAVKLRLPDRLAAGPATSEQLAASLGLSAPHLARFLRGLCSLGICEELPDGAFALTTDGECLLSSSPSRLAEKVQIVVGQYWWPWANFMSSLKSGKPAFEQMFGARVSDWRAEHAEQGALFASFLTSETFDQAGSTIEALESAAEAERVADIGGGCGGLLVALLIAYPHLSGALFDRPQLIEMAKPFLQVFAQFGLTERVDLVAGDVLADVPVRANLYLLKGVLQQWDDAHARTILANCRKAMPEGARLAVIERLLPKRAGDDPAAIMLDLHMMTITGGRLRSLADFTTLLSEAGLKLTKATPTGSGLAIIEALPD